MNVYGETNNPKIVENKVQETLHFRYLKFLVIKTPNGGLVREMGPRLFQGNRVVGEILFHLARNHLTIWFWTPPSAVLGFFFPHLLNRLDPKGWEQKTRKHNLGPLIHGNSKLQLKKQDSLLHPT